MAIMTWRLLLALVRSLTSSLHSALVAEQKDPLPLSCGGKVLRDEE